MRRRNFLFSAVGFISLLIAIDPAHARRARFRPGIRGGVKRYTPDVLTEEQLKSCLINRSEIDSLEKLSVDSSHEISSYESTLDNFREEIEMKQYSINKYDSNDVDSYNFMVDRYEVMRKHFNSKVDEHNDFIERINSEVMRFNARCGQKSYYEDDMISASTALGIKIPID